MYRRKYHVTTMIDIGRTLSDIDRTLVDIGRTLSDIGRTLADIVWQWLTKSGDLEKYI